MSRGQTLLCIFKVARFRYGKRINPGEHETKRNYSGIITSGYVAPPNNGQMFRLSRSLCEGKIQLRYLSNINWWASCSSCNFSRASLASALDRSFSFSASFSAFLSALMAAVAASCARVLLSRPRRFLATITASFRDALSLSVCGSFNIAERRQAAEG